MYGGRSSYGGGSRYGRRDGYGDRGNSSGRRNRYSDPIEKENDPVPFEKNFYVPTVTMPEDEAEELRRSANMKLIGNNINLPVDNFTSLGFPDEVVEHFKRKDYTKPTPIQAQGWPMALSGRDMVGIASTGSGKTISFVLPALIHASAQPALRENDGPIVLILAPTRELVNQIQEVVAEYVRYFKLRSLAVYGGTSMDRQINAIRAGAEIVVATPGRLIDLHNNRQCPLNRVSFLVLDEADRMLDMGFEPQLQQIIPKTNPQRQTLMWSATWPMEVRRLASDFMQDFIQVTIGGEKLKANPNIIQRVEVVSHYDKKDKLLAELSKCKNERIIIFCNMKRTCDIIEALLGDNGYNAVAIHGDKTQGARDAVIDGFKRGRRNILIATDVAGRGIDVPDVKHVINYDFPTSADDYVHRIGRTARGNSKEGFAYTMVCNDDRSNISKLIAVLKESGQDVPKELVEFAGRGGGFSSGGRGGGRGGSFGGSRGGYGGGSRGRRYGF